MSSIGNTFREPINVALVDDHELARQGIRGALRRDKSIKIVGEAGNPEEAKALIRSVKPHVVVLDIRLGNESGIEVAKDVLAQESPTKVLVLSAYSSRQYVAAAARLGISGYLAKSASATELNRAIHEVAKGGMVFGPEVADSLRFLLEGTETDGYLPCGGNESLTTREKEVLSYLSTGSRNNEIATAMGISLRTVETHVEHILVKLGAKTRTQAVVNASARGWI